MSVDPGTPIDVPDADAAEQAREVRARESVTTATVSLEVDEYDAAEQSIVVEDDEDDYR